MLGICLKHRFVAFVLIDQYKHIPCIIIHMGIVWLRALCSAWELVIGFIEVVHFFTEVVHVCKKLCTFHKRPNNLTFVFNCLVGGSEPGYPDTYVYIEIINEPNLATPLPFIIYLPMFEYVLCLKTIKTTDNCWMISNGFIPGTLPSNVEMWRWQGPDLRFRGEMVGFSSGF